MYKYPVRKISIEKLSGVCQYLESELESRSENKDYAKIYKKLTHSKSGYIYLTTYECDLISAIYEDDDNYTIISNILYGKYKKENKQLNETVEDNYRNKVNDFYNDFKEVVIDEGPQASLILSLVYDDLYKNNIRLDIVQRYADVDYDIYQMLLARKALLSGLDDIEVDFIFNTKLSQDTQSEIINSLRTDVPYLTVKSWIKNHYTPAQIELATRCYVMKIRQVDTDYLVGLNLDDEMTQYVKQALQYFIPVSQIKEYLTEPSIEFKRAIRRAKIKYKTQGVN